ncbi:MAG: DinB family protein [Chitinophagaceae bacterium]|nr:DinB family protein [Chitinophagaceae bacterium]
MRKVAIIFSVIAFCSFIVNNDPITSEERKFAADYLKSTEKYLEKKVKGLSEAQLKYKAAPDRWSVEDCLKHIAMAEMGIWHMTDSVINTPENPEKRSEIKSTDQQVITMINDRSHKAQAPEQLQPQNTPFHSAKEALESFKSSRDKLIAYVEKTDKDLRNHVTTFPVGSFDAYQMILFIGAHSQRHTKQIEEVMADPGFPKK